MQLVQDDHQIQNMSITICFLVFGVHMIILFSIKENFIVLIHEMVI